MTGGHKKNHAFPIQRQSIPPATENRALQPAGHLFDIVSI
jgi:hypothetical protein